jgi:hypothetical protein
MICSTFTSREAKLVFLYVPHADRGFGGVGMAHQAAGCNPAMTSRRDLQGREKPFGVLEQKFSTKACLTTSFQMRSHSDKGIFKTAQALEVAVRRLR